MMRELEDRTSLLLDGVIGLRAQANADRWTEERPAKPEGPNRPTSIIPAAPPAQKGSCKTKDPPANETLARPNSPRP
ncbi:unnamed protein product [Penicillium palitans]